MWVWCVFSNTTDFFSRIACREADGVGGGGARTLVDVFAHLLKTFAHCQKHFIFDTHTLLTLPHRVPKA